MRKSLVFVIVIFLIIVGAFSLRVNAKETINVNDWKPQLSGSNTKLNNIAGKILGVVQVIGSVTSVIALVVIGIKYMTGSIEEKASYKSSMLPYIIGCILVFSVTNIAVIIYNIALGIL